MTTQHLIDLALMKQSEYKFDDWFLYKINCLIEAGTITDGSDMVRIIDLFWLSE